MLAVNTLIYSYKTLSGMIFLEDNLATCTKGSKMCKHYF